MHAGSAAIITYTYYSQCMMHKIEQQARIYDIQLCMYKPALLISYIYRISIFAFKPERYTVKPVLSGHSKTDKANKDKW